MRNTIRKAKEGFTLIELMIVVAIVGILAVLAIYGVRKYIANSKTAEARNSLGQIGKDAQTAYEKESMAPAILAMGSSTAVLRSLCGNAAPVPGTLTNIDGKKYQSQGSDWNTTTPDPTKGWYCLKFTLEQPQYYQYNYTITGGSSAPGATFTAVAIGNLNGDTTYSTFSLQGSINTSYALNIAPNLQEVNPEE